MASTTTKTRTNRLVLNQGDLDFIADVMRRIQLGDMLSIIKVTVTGLSAASAIDITSAAVKAAATYTGIDTLATNVNLPAIKSVISLRVTASGTAASQIPHIVTDASGTPAIPAATTAGANVGVATLSDDGKTLTFANTITAFVLEYAPRAATSLDLEFAPKT